MRIHLHNLVTGISKGMGASGTLQHAKASHQCGQGGPSLQRFSGHLYCPSSPLDSSFAFMLYKLSRCSRGNT